ncbi:MAG: DNA replication/repair protein RecF, partial [Chitinophagaceae bacterium]
MPAADEFQKPFCHPLFFLHICDALLRIRSISLFQFRNYSSRECHFTDRLVGFCGANGVGKTTLLDAIYYSCFTRSYFTKSDALLVQNGQKGFRLQTELECQGKSHQLTVLLRENGKKEVYLDQELIPRLSQYVGKFPAVMVCPDDSRLISGSSEERRTYLDVLFSQLDSEYLQQLVVYQKVMQQRNAFLKMVAHSGNYDAILLDSFDDQLIRSGSQLYAKRNLYLQELIPAIRQHYQYISGSAAAIDIDYQSALHQKEFANILRNNRKKDLLLQRTEQGLHRDDLLFSWEGLPFKNTCSQGQRKSLLFACKLAEYDCLSTHKGFAPLLLLDDAFEKLDAQRTDLLL